MDDTADTAQVIIHPPVAWGLAVIAGLALNCLVPWSSDDAGNGGPVGVAEAAR